MLVLLGNEYLKEVMETNFKQLFEDACRQLLKIVSEWKLVFNSVVLAIIESVMSMVMVQYKA